jgi:hypothetical protein
VRYGPVLGWTSPVCHEQNKEPKKNYRVSGIEPKALSINRFVRQLDGPFYSTPLVQKAILESLVVGGRSRKAIKELGTTDKTLASEREEKVDAVLLQACPTATISTLGALKTVIRMFFNKRVCAWQKLQYKKCASSL